MMTSLLPPLSKLPLTLTMPLTMTTTLTMTSYLDHDLDQDHDHDQLMHMKRRRVTRGYEDRLAQSVGHSVAHGESIITTDPGSGANTLIVTAHSAGGLREGAPGPCIPCQRRLGNLREAT